MSNRKRLKPRHPAAHLDGLHLDSGCCDAVLRVTSRRHGLHAADVMHDPDCPIYSDDPAVSFGARMAANLAMSRATGKRTAIVVPVDGGLMILLPPDEEAS